MSLLKNEDGVHGVVLRQTCTDGQIIERTLNVKGGVVMASGGFNRHPTRRADMLPGALEKWCPAGPGHTGSAQQLALDAGGSMG